MKIAKNISLASILVTAALLAVSCASDKEPAGGVVKTIPLKKLAPPQIEDSLNPGKPGDPKPAPNESGVAEVKGSSITLKKSSLGTTFLMSMLLTTSDNAARPNVLLPKVVSFVMNGTELALTEENAYSIYKEIPSDKLLQTFNIESQDEETVTFKWNYGLASIPTKGFYVVSDAPDGTTEQLDPNEESLPAVASYLKYARIQNNRLELRQLSRVRGGEAVLDEKTQKIIMSTKETSVQLDIAFTPYKENPRFKPRLSTKQQGVGYFETAQIRKTEGPIDILASRWDLSKEAGLITYAISKTTPPEAVEAMKEGVLYWNQVSQAALGRDIMQVETGADPLQAPRPRTVMVYWVPYSGAGSAYANFQPDPITGEITSGLVYQTSVFYLSGKQRGRRFVNRNVENKIRVVAPTGFRSAAICDYKDSSLVGQDPQLDGLDEKISMKMGLDYLRHVVAHEVGHTLGLRHNWAGSLASELATPAEAKEKFKEYLSDPTHPGAMISSSVMEYSTFRDSIMEGAAIGSKKFLSYDKAAIDWGYSEKVVRADDIKAPLFCTDVEGGGGKTFGCSPDDSGPKPLSGHAASIARNRSLLASVIVESLVDSIRPDKEADSITVERALAKWHPDRFVYPAPVGLNLASEFPHFIRYGGVGIKSIVIDREAKGVNWVNQKEYAEKSMSFMAKEFEDAGGLHGILKVAYDLDDAFHAKKGWLKEAVIAKISAADFAKGKTLNGNPYELNALELEKIRGTEKKLGAAVMLAEAVENVFLRDLLMAVTGIEPSKVHEGVGKPTIPSIIAYPDTTKAWAPYIAQDSWQAPLSALSEQLATDSEGEIEGTVDGKPVKVPQPKFSIEVRLAAMRLFSPKVFGGRNADAWMKEGEEKLTKAMIDRLAPVLKITDGNPDRVEPVGKDTSKELVEWAQKELAVLKALKTARQ